MFGKNIKKIRGVKGLTQQAFAELFGLKRATLAAYEEGRSNPRVETVLKIAAHFNLEMDELMKTELTVNRLLAFNDSLTTNTDPLPMQAFCQIPCLIEALEADFIRQGGMATRKLPTLQLPLPEAQGYIGYTLHAADMASHGKGYLPKDIIIGYELPRGQWINLKPGTPALALSGSELVFRKATVHENELWLEAEMEGLDPVIWPLNGVKKIWEARHVFHWKLPTMADTLEQRLQLLENRLRDLQV